MSEQLRRAAVLRSMTFSDLDDVVRVQEDGAVAGLGHIFPQSRFPFPVDAIRSRWRSELSDPGTRCFVVLGDDRRVAGFAAVRGDEFLHFGTALDTWGTGLAGRAHDEVLAEFRADGHRSARLRVFEANARARRFYERRGWAPTGERSASPFAPHPILVGYRVELAEAERGE